MGGPKPSERPGRPMGRVREQTGKRLWKLAVVLWLGQQDLGRLGRARDDRVAQDERARRLVVEGRLLVDGLLARLRVQS